MFNTDTDFSYFYREKTTDMIGEKASRRDPIKQRRKSSNTAIRPASQFLTLLCTVPTLFGRGRTTNGLCREGV